MTVRKATLSPSGRSFDIAPEQSILAAGLAAGVKMPYGCRMGTCRSCRGRVLSGAVDFGAAHPTYLTPEDRAKGYALLCQAKACSDLVIELEELPPLADPVTTPAIVKSIEFAADDVAIVKLRLPLHLNLRFESGQYADVLLPNGLRRSYSMANPSTIDAGIDLDFHIRHMPGGLFTDHVFSAMRERDKVQLEAPLGTFFLRDSEKPALFLASGTGYAPIRSILLHALSSNPTRPMVLYWGGRRLQDLYLMQEAAALAARHPNFTFVPVLSEPLAKDDWTGATGLVHLAALSDLGDLSGWQVYACGAPLMVDAARRDFTNRAGLPETEFYANSFVSAADLARTEA